MCGFLRARVARLVSVEMQGKLDILAENVEEDGFVAGVCFLQDDSGEGSAFFKTTPLSGAPGRGAFLGSCCPLTLPERLWRHPTPKRCDCWRTASVKSAL